MSEKPASVWLDKSLDWNDLIARGRARVLSEGALLLIVEASERLIRHEFVYVSTLCLDLFYGELVYYISNEALPDDHVFRRLV